MSENYSYDTEEDDEKRNQEENRLLIKKNCTRLARNHFESLEGKIQSSTRVKGVLTFQIDYKEALDFYNEYKKILKKKKTQTKVSNFSTKKQNQLFSDGVQRF